MNRFIVAIATTGFFGAWSTHATAQDNWEFGVGLDAYHLKLDHGKEYLADIAPTRYSGAGLVLSARRGKAAIELEYISNGNDLNASLCYNGMCAPGKASFNFWITTVSFVGYIPIPHTKSWHIVGKVGAGYGSYDAHASASYSTSTVQADLSGKHTLAVAGLGIEYRKPHSPAAFRIQASIMDNRGRSEQLSVLMQYYF